MLSSVDEPFSSGSGEPPSISVVALSSYVVLAEVCKSFDVVFLVCEPDQPPGFSVSLSVAL